MYLLCALELSRLVGESAVQVPSQSSLDQYTAWLNVSNFTEAHQGQYSFLFQTSPPLRTLFHHRFTLLSASKLPLILDTHALAQYCQVGGLD